MKAANLFAIVIGLFLLVEGIWGLTSPVVFGVLTTNLMHACIHILLGLAGIVLGLRKCARGFCIFLGVILIAVGALLFVPGVSGLIVKMLNANMAVAYVNFAVGAVALLVAFLPGDSGVRR